MTPRRERAVDALVLALAKLAIGAWVLHQGFTHVSDDDYARTVIAQQFAHAPRLDPSGTSWLPLPFWLEGTAMLVAGRSLAVARTVAVLLGAIGIAAPYLAMRAVGMGRLAAMGATGIAMALPWNAWLGVAAVPEGWVAALVAAAVIAMDRREARPWAAAALLAASLSRYEAWPACAMFAALCGWRAVRGARRREIACALVAVAGPVVWMAWNVQAHGSATHFLTRVTTFRQTIGAADAPLADKLLDYPRALVEGTPEVALLAVVALAGVAEASFRTRWKWPAITALAIGAFLVCGDVRDGAPTHHPARAIVCLWWVVAAMALDASSWMVARWAGEGRRKVAVAIAGTALGAVWFATLPGRWSASPGRSAPENRDAQLARGLDMRTRAVPAAEITPCSFEHFALMAAWAEPERVTVASRTGQPADATCPRVVER